MREILFRAKYVNALPGGHLYKAWIYGYLCDNNHINSPFPTEGEFEININTVCQYTGLTDKNGKKIFEDDIVKAGENLVVSWKEKLASWCLCKKGWMYNHFFGEAVDAKDCEVIGNIFDNPELLGGQGGYGK